MPDLSIENARNVSINLKEEYGQFVMIQLFFAAKWILVSEVTFISGESLVRIPISLTDPFLKLTPYPTYIWVPNFCAVQFITLFVVS